MAKRKMKEGSPFEKAYEKRLGMKEGSKREEAFDKKIAAKPKGNPFAKKK
jgi:hypothetical protein